MGAKLTRLSSGSLRRRPPPPDPINPDVTSYEDAIKSDPALKSFDSDLQTRTTRVISSIATDIDAQVRSLSLDSLIEVTESLLEVNHEVAKLILQSKEDIWKSEDLFTLVEDYFETSLQTLDFCTELEKCLKRARDSQIIIQVAVEQFREERGEIGLNAQRCSKTLDQFRKFKEGGDPFSDEFFGVFERVYKQQVAMFEKLQARKSKLDKKLRSAKGWKRVSNVIFIATFASVLVLTVVAAAIAAPPVVTAVAAAAAVPLGSMGKWLNSLWNKYERELQGQIDLIGTMQVGTYVVIKDLDGIRLLVDRLEIEMEGFLHHAEFGIREEEEAAVAIAVDEIKKKLSGFAKIIEDLSEHADKCGRDIRRARTVILRRIINHKSNSL